MIQEQNSSWGRIVDIATEQHTTPRDLVVKHVEAGGISWAAEQLEVEPNAVRYWLKKHNLKVERTCVYRVVEMLS